MLVKCSLGLFPASLSCSRERETHVYIIKLSSEEFGMSLHAVNVLINESVDTTATHHVRDRFPKDKRVG